ncbi:hypothetical protein HYPBUDRAFT_152645 [Hyphopichia burtonii NRRL Y-1933]|uniref:Uncharacterized protein n=1 Tax=Hyphopichia burtonii NRRL Y-1933 TaxID=984485 RepID=A0A1E4RKV6_9ASCO|nr:hypothetical protein HYPBUDRAFT_152645 [Hyphopichia burtonii NRRL Y-1933]ODV67912.1 hypothetical protein HYPBUDRAFT_152645 [Hyphopichia burtonii NRRL Y-1933]
MFARESKATKESKFQQFKKTPAYTAAVNVTLFAVGVAIIQSPIADYLVPQL